MNACVQCAHAPEGSTLRRSTGDAQRVAADGAIRRGSQPSLAPRQLLLLMGISGLLLYAYTLGRYGHAFATIDGYLYYAHAHSWYFDGDLDVANDLRSSPGLGGARDAYLSLLSSNGRVTNMMPVGWAIVALPGLAAGDALTALHNLFAEVPLPRDGYSSIYAATVPLPHVALGFAGLLAAYALARQRASAWTSAWATAAVCAGTSAVYYVFAEPTMSHAASLGLLSGSCWMAEKIRQHGWSLRRSAGLGLCVGLMVAVRYYDVVWSLVPLMLVWRRIVERDESQGRRGGIKWAGVSILAAGLCLLPQVIVNLAVEGELLGRVARYAPRLGLPRMDLELWAPQTGLLSLYPLTALALLGLAAGWRRRKQDPLPLALAAGFAVYVAFYAFAYCPGYSRRYTSCAVVFVVGLSLLLKEFASWPMRLRVLVLTLVALCVANLAQVAMIQTGHLDRRIITQGYAELATFVCG